MPRRRGRGLSRRKLIIVSGAAGLFTLLALWLTGTTSDAKAIRLIQSASPSIRFFAASTMTASSTVLALMVTVLGISRSIEATFDAVHYQRLHELGIVQVVTFLGALLLLSFVTLPVEAANNVEANWYSWIYYGLITYVSLLTGVIAAMVWMLYELLADLIGVATGSNSDLLLDDQDDY